MWPANWFKKRKAAAALGASEGRLKILAVSIFLNDRLVLEQLGKRAGWELRVTNSPREAFRLVMEKHFEVVLCDRNQCGYPWREVIERLAENSPRSRILLVSPMNDDYLWRDVVQKGGYDVLTSPLREADTLHTISAAAGFLSSLSSSSSASRTESGR
jgi:two-component system, NtrC family, response regulator HydG